MALPPNGGRARWKSGEMGMLRVRGPPELGDIFQLEGSCMQRMAMERRWIADRRPVHVLWRTHLKLLF